MQAGKKACVNVEKPIYWNLMPDDVLPVQKAISSTEEDFPTLKNDTSNSSTANDTPPEAPAWYKPPTTPEPEAPIAPVPTDTPQPTIATNPAPPSPQTPELPPSQTPTNDAPSGIFTPLGGTNPSPGSGASLPHIQYSSRPMATGGFETLEKVITSIPNKKDDLTSVNMFPDTVPQTEKPKSPLALIATIVIIFILVALPLTAVYTIAYGYVDIGNKQLTDNISNFVQSLPLTPKTPKYLLTQTTIAQKNITKESFDLSFAVRSKELESVFNSTQVEAAIKGSIDYEDPKDVKMSINASITKDFNADLRTIDHKAYFHINKLPLTLLAMVGLSEEMVQPLIKDWVFYDTTPLETEANKILDSKADQDSSYKEFVEKIQTIVFNDQILNNITVTEENIGKTPVQKLHFVANDDTINYLGKAINTQFNEQATLPQDEKYSDYIKDLNIDLWTENNTYHMRKLNISFRTLSNTGDPKLGTQKSSSDIAFSYSLSDIGKEVKVEVPQDAISLDKFVLQIQQKFSEMNQQSEASLIGRPAPVNFTNLLPMQ